MNEEELRSIMLNACRRQPSFVFNLLEQENERNQDPAPQPGNLDWCTCTYCTEMSEGEQGCCKENSERCHSRKPVNIFFHTPFTILLHNFIFDSFVVTPALTLPSPCNLLFVCNIHFTI